MYKLQPLRYPADSLGSNTQIIFHQYSWYVQVKTRLGNQQIA